MKTETQSLLERVAQFVSETEKEFPKQKLARALVAAGCNVSIAKDSVNATAWMLGEASGLIAGHWTSDRIELFIDVKR